MQCALGSTPSSPFPLAARSESILRFLRVQGLVQPWVQLSSCAAQQQRRTRLQRHWSVLYLRCFRASQTKLMVFFSCFFLQAMSDAMLLELKQCFMEAYDDNQDGKIDIREVSHDI